MKANQRMGGQSTNIRRTNTIQGYDLILFGSIPLRRRLVFHPGYPIGHPPHPTLSSPISSFAAAN
jgi:hypothetical protein